MTGPFDKKDDEFDWDAELSKWEAAFEPEMAKEKKEDARASAGAVTAAPPLAETPAAPPPRSPSARPPAPPPGLSPPRPPVAPPRPAPSASRVPAPTASRSPEPPRVSPPAPPVAAPPAPPSAPRVPAPGQHGLIDFTAPSEEEEPTHVRDVPTVLRATTTPPPERPSRPSRAGLGQLFGRAEPPSSRNRLSTRPAEEELVRALPDLKQAETQDDEDNEPTRVGEVREAIESLRRPQPSSVPPPPPSSPEIYAPLQRAHDPDVETGVVDVRAIELPKMPVAPPAPASDSGPALAVGEEEIPLDLAEAPEESAEPAVDPMRVRAEWLEDEARRMQNAQDRARALLTVSELRAQLGDREDALRLACEARDQAPQLPLAHAQARGLLDRGDLAGLIDAVDRSRKFPSTAEASVHEALLAAIAHHVRGNDDEMRRRWTDASQVGLEDARVLVGSVALALARGDVPATNITIPDREEMAPLREAVNGVRRTRGLDAPNATTPWVDDSLRRAREALASGDVATASVAIAELRAINELSGAATWLGFALGGAAKETRAASVEALRGRPDRRARRALAVRGMELGDVGLLEGALGSEESFSIGERLGLGLLARADEIALRELDRLAEEAPQSPLVAAAAELLDRAPLVHVAGSEPGKRAARVARALASSSDALAEAALARAEDATEESRALLLALSLGKQDWGDVSDALIARQATDGDALDAARNLSAAIIAERAGDTTRATVAYEATRRAEPRFEVALRALAELSKDVDLATDLGPLAEETTDANAAALLRLEALARRTGGDDAARLETLDGVHRSAPDLPMAAFLAERIARRQGDEELLLRWVRARRAATTDPLEGALDAVREALLVADGDARLAGERLEEAHRARPDDVALRELYERLAAEPPTDRASWREGRASRTAGPSRQVFFLEAALEHERAGDLGKARQAATSASEPKSDLAQVVLDRLDLAAGEATRMSDELLDFAKTTGDPVARREAYERLAEVDQVARSDAGAALLWHRAILDEAPDHLPSLRHVEQALISAGGEELEPIAASIAKALDGSSGGECAAHAELASRLRMRAGDWLGTYDLADLARKQPSPTTFSLRLFNAHARMRGDASEELSSALALVERSTRSRETASLLVDAAGAAARLGDHAEARTLLERAVQEDPSDLLAWQELSSVRRTAGDLPAAAEALEALARASLVDAHKLDAWYQAALLWQEEVKDDARAITAFEQVATLEITYKDTFVRLSGRYAARGAQSELASLLERRRATVTDPAEIVKIDLERGRVLADVGDLDGARAAFDAALEREPDHADALDALAELASKHEDWDAAEKAWVRLARLVQTPEEQKTVYARLGDLYATHTLNLSRAEVAYKEVLKRAPDDVPTLEKLVRVHKKQNDAAQALTAQQALLAKAANPAEKRQRVIELADIYETVSHDNRKAEQALDAARRENPTDTALLRALAEFYTRHKQTPAVHMLLDRSAADAKRAFAAGRFSPALFEVMATVHELRGKKDAARVVNAALAAFSGTAVDVPGAGARASDPRLDDLLAPDVVTPALRALFSRTGAALDVALPLDARALRATPLPASARDVAEVLQTYAQAMGLSGVQVYVSPTLGSTCVAAGGQAQILVLGEPLLTAENARARTFLIVRGMKLLQTRASALTRAQGRDIPSLVGAWLTALNPSWKAEGLNPTLMAELGKRLQPGLPKKPDPDLGLLALEVAGAVGSQATILGPAILGWVNRAALLAVGDPSAALDAIAWSQGTKGGVPTTPQERAAWIARTAEARDLLAFSVTDAFAEARARAGAG